MLALLFEIGRWLRKAKRYYTFFMLLALVMLILWRECFFKGHLHQDLCTFVTGFICMSSFLHRPGVITMQALSEEDRRLWMEAMDGREPVSAILGSRARIKVLSCSLLPRCGDRCWCSKAWGLKISVAEGVFFFYSWADICRC